MMPDVRIRKLETKYRLPSLALAERRRLDQLRTTVVEKAFSQAIEKAGLADDVVLCIRSLSSRVSLRLRVSDQSLISQWSAMMADEIVRTISHGSSLRAVVYRSRRQALLDFAIGVGRGDFTRSWAWKQLGLSQSTVAGSDSQAVFELVRSLCSEPAMVIPTLRVLAEAGCLSRIAEQVTEPDWEALAITVLSDAIMSDAISDNGTARLLDGSVDAPSVRALREARRVINRSLLVSALGSSHWLAAGSVRVRRSIAALAIADVEPALLQSNAAAAVLEIIADSCVAGGEIPDEIVKATSLTPDTLDSESQASGEQLQREAEVEPQESEDVAPEIGQHAVESRRDQKTTTPTSEPETSTRLGRHLNEADENGKPLDLRQRVFTRWGGLLFMCAVLEDLNLPDVILAHPLLGRRYFTWVLHQLAVTIAAIPPNDPAALVFAGLSPTARPPSTEEPPPNEQESAVLGELVTRITDHLLSCLDFEAESPADVVEFVCCRRVEIVADPGWIEVRLSLDEVSTEIRRAGLDLDPGYVSWLGFVLRFVYE